ncbi:MAG: DUF1552 domain-containing protein [Verrucomicrobiota bacterium]|jgi:hypothetical protein|nr:DUF1552 domain-containing protein [Verrucomicrobiota bacterium]MDP7049459.1 DUF1552 domain-containing protein [Verrucomicrobiota bacterium]
MNVLKNTNIPRRTFLRGCGAALALPFLDVMQVRGAKTAAPKRVAFFYTPNGVAQEAWHPKETGHNFTLSRTLQPLQPVREKISLFTNLDRVKVPGTDGHAQAGACYLSTAAPDELSPAGYPLKRTIDQVIADTAGKVTPFRSLELSCNSFTDNRESVYFDNISWYGHGHVARSIKDPRKVFQRLFNVKEHQANASVLDLVRADAKDLQDRLGRLDRHKLDEYMDSVRTVEQQIERITKHQVDARDLGIEHPEKLWTMMRRDEYIQVMGDLMILALQTDLTRVSTMMVAPERWDTPLMFEDIFEKPIRHHGWTHNQNNKQVLSDLEKLDLFHMRQFSRLCQKMDVIQEGDDTLLDNLMFTYGSGLSSGMLHECTNLPTIIVGGAVGQLKNNRHDEHPKGTPIANLWVSMAQAMGCPVKQLGDSTGPLKGFLV